MIKIDDFGDFNYEQIAFDISEVDKKALRSRLEFDYINHLYELDHAGYFAIWNYDCQGFLKESDIYFWGDDSVYDLYKLVQKDDGWYREFVGMRLVRYDLRM
jgi:hypothetical protein